jgi:ADP-ribose pyrophosphatase YjhB (NUDIX family)
MMTGAPNVHLSGSRRGRTWKRDHFRLIGDTHEIMPLRSFADVPNRIVRLFLQEAGRQYDRNRGYTPFGRMPASLIARFGGNCAYCGMTTTLVLDVAAYLTPVAPPPDLVVSVCCIVQVDGRVVVCENPNETHVVPGGRREPGETFEATARREVHEETGWLVDESDLRLLGFLHFRHTEVLPDDHPYLHPDFLQVIYTAPARTHDNE